MYGGSNMITATQPDVVSSGKYSPLQASKALKIDRHTLLKYANMGAIKYGLHRRSKRRFYTGFEIIRFWKTF